MIKNFSQLHTQVEGKDFYLNAEFNSTFPQVKEALFQFQKSIGSIEDQIKVQQEQIEADKRNAESSEASNVEEKPAE